MNNSNSPNIVPPLQQLQLMKILCGAMFMSVLMFGYVLFMTGNLVFDQILFNELIKNQSYMILLIAGVALLALRIPISNLLFKSALQNVALEDSEKLVRAYFVPMILRLALAEAGALMGFMAAFLHKESSSYLILGASALFAILREIPSLPKIQQRARMLLSGRVSRTRGIK